MTCRTWNLSTVLRRTVVGLFLPFLLDGCWGLGCLCCCCFCRKDSPGPRDSAVAVAGVGQDSTVAAYVSPRSTRLFAQAAKGSLKPTKWGRCPKVFVSFAGSCFPVRKPPGSNFFTVHAMVSLFCSQPKGLLGLRGFSQGQVCRTDCFREAALRQHSHKTLAACCLKGNFQCSQQSCLLLSFFMPHDPELCKQCSCY